MSIDGIERKYKIIVKTINSHAQRHLPQLRAPLRLPAPPRVRLFKPMLAATVLVIVLIASWSGLTVMANRTLLSDGRPDIDLTNFPVPASNELIGPIPLTTNEPDMRVVAETFLKLLAQYRENHVSVDGLAERIEQLRPYLASKGSPLAQDDQALQALALANNTRMILAISFVESNFCRRHLAFNCSGIGGATYFRHYRGFQNWVLDFDRLLDRRYGGLDVEEMNCYYVQPCNARWVNGVYQILTELKARGIS